MHYSEIMVRYGELSTKGKNRMRFINSNAISNQSYQSIRGFMSRLTVTALISICMEQTISQSLNHSSRFLGFRISLHLIGLKSLYQP